MLVLCLVWRGTCCLLHGEIDPFLRPYALALDDLGSDGDLLLRTPLCKWHVDDDMVIDVVLAHQQEPLEYAEVRSRFDLLPFQTSVMPLGAKGWIWLRPGGGEIRFETLSRKSPERKTNRKEFGESAGGWGQIFNTGKVRLTVWPSTNQQIIEDDGWELSYKDGALFALKTPSGRQLAVSSVGRRINQVSEQGILRVKIEWTGAAVPARLWLDGAIIDFKVSSSGTLHAVTTGAGDIVAEFSYHDDGLLASIACPGVPPRFFSWRLIDGYARGDSIYRKPYALQSAGNVYYGYDIRRGVIRLSAESSNSRKSLNIGMQYGKVQWISEKSGLPWWRFD